MTEWTESGNYSQNESSFAIYLLNDEVTIEKIQKSETGEGHTPLFIVERGLAIGARPNSKLMRTKNSTKIRLMEISRTRKLKAHVRLARTKVQSTRLYTAIKYCHIEHASILCVT